MAHTQTINPTTTDYRRRAAARRIVALSRTRTGEEIAAAMLDSGDLDADEPVRCCAFGAEFGFCLEHGTGRTR